MAITPKLLPARFLKLKHPVVTTAVLVTVTVVTSATIAKRAVEPGAMRGRTFAQSVVGLTGPSDVGVVVIPTALTVSEVLVAVGDELTAGQPIARVDYSEGRNELAQLGVELAFAKREVTERQRGVEWTQGAIQQFATAAAETSAQLTVAEGEAQRVPMRQAKDSPERAQVAYEQAVHKAQRFEQLFAAGLVAKQELEDAQFGIRVAADDLANARMAAEAAARVQTAEGAHAQAQRGMVLVDHRRQLLDQQASLEQARLRLNQVQARFDLVGRATADTFIRAPRAGAIVELPMHAGDRMTAGALVAKIASLDPIAVDFDVEPSLVHVLQVGDPAGVDIAAIGMSTRESHIRSIAPLPGDDGNYQVRVTFPNPAHAHIAGQTANVLLTWRDRTSRP